MYKVVLFSKKIRKIKNLNQFFPDYQFVNKRKKVDAVAGWGLRPTTQSARTYAKQYDLPFIALEDGFLRSAGLGLDGYSPLSLIADDIGIYYDSTHPSKLELLIKDKPRLSELALDAQIAKQQIIKHQLSKYNHAPDFKFDEGDDNSETQKILVIDQTVGDMAVKYGGADQTHFIEMLNDAIDENPNSTIYVKTHPDVINGFKQGYLTEAIDKQNVRLLSSDANPLSLLKQMDKIYVVTSQMGFEALLLHKPVITYGLPWYAGWGVTEDRHPDIQNLKKEQRRTEANILELFAAAYLLYCQYINPNTGKKGTILDVIDYLAKLKRFNNLLRGELNLIGLSFWKQQVLRPYLKLPSVKLNYHSLKSYQKIMENKKTNSLKSHSKLLIWGQGKSPLLSMIHKYQQQLIRMEDGFIRSIGLGSNLVMPYSLVLDQQGIYFNAQTVSELEQMISSYEVEKLELAKAELLKHLLIKTRIAKYNVGKSQKITLKNLKMPIILIPGQVEDDASILYGSPFIKTNLDLIKKVRELNPNHYLIYKPHPDVVSGNRKGHVNQRDLDLYVNEIIDTADIIDCIELVDEVHTMTSLTGFEALIRDKKVVCYGHPFYAGWGLTTDVYSLKRRVKQLTLSELIYIVMFEYAIYIHPETLSYTDPITLVQYLHQQKQRIKSDVKQFWLKKQINKLVQLIKITIKMR